MIVKKKVYCLTAAYWGLISAFILAGCSGSGAIEDTSLDQGIEKLQIEELQEEKTEDSGMDSGMEAEGCSIESNAEDSMEGMAPEPTILEEDWSEYFDGLNGTAVIYDAFLGRYIIYNGDLALTRSSPCSTFKIISSLIALENGILEQKLE